MLRGVRGTLRSLRTRRHATFESSAASFSSPRAPIVHARVDCGGIAKSDHVAPRTFAPFRRSLRLALGHSSVVIALGRRSSDARVERSGRRDPILRPDGHSTQCIDLEGRSHTATSPLPKEGPASWAWSVVLDVPIAEPARPSASNPPPAARLLGAHTSRHGRHIHSFYGPIRAGNRGGIVAQPTLTPREFAKKWGDNATRRARPPRNTSSTCVECSTSRGPTRSIGAARTMRSRGVPTRALRRRPFESPYRRVDFDLTEAARLGARFGVGTLDHRRATR